MLGDGDSGGFHTSRMAGSERDYYAAGGEHFIYERDFVVVKYRKCWQSVGVNRVSSRLASIAPSATLAVDSKAKALKAQGENVIGFGAGEPDFPTPAHIVDAAAAACHEVKNHRYSPAGGLPELREAIAAKTMRDFVI